MNWIRTRRYTLFILLGLLCLFLLAVQTVVRLNPEQIITGQWKETGWTYENIDTRNFVYHDIKLTRKHEAESWRITSDGRLYFYNGQDIAAEATWKIKGRAHVLQITYEDGSTELYNIKELTNDYMVLNFDIGIESRGIARLVFHKLKNS